MSRSRTFTKDEQEQARKDLRKMLKPGDTVSVIQRHVSRSGMMRHLSLVVVDKKTKEITDITWLAGAAMGDRVYDDYHWTLHVGGAGMDMHFHTVYCLSRALYPNGHKCTGQDSHGKGRCPSNDHSNDYGTAQRAFFQDLEERGVERLYGHTTDAEIAQHAEMREYIENRMATDLGYRKDRVHSDGGYALSHRSL